jgi:hypothetical protein
MIIPQQKIKFLLTTTLTSSGIPDNHYTKLMVGFGYPEIPYARGVQKDRSAKIHRYTKEQKKGQKRR